VGVRVRGIGRFFVHTVTVETRTGTGAAGDVYAAPVVLSPDNLVPNGVFLEGKVQLVRDSTGQEVTANSTLYCAVADGARFTPDTKVTTGGRISRVISQNINDAPGLNLPDHAEIYLK
jgi:hypothetical protein